MAFLEIEQVTGRMILDSRGTPTVEAEVRLRGGAVGRGAAPSGASTGTFEARELRDGDDSRFGGKGVSNAVRNINTAIRRALCARDASDQTAIDLALTEADGTPNKSRLGANAVLAVSIASARAAAHALGLPLYRFLGGTAARCLPVPMMNVLNGGAHAANTIDVQEFMILPLGAPNFQEAVRWCAEVYAALRTNLHRSGLSTAVGDEGGFAPDLPNSEAAIRCLLEAIESAGFRPGADFMLALDAAANEWTTGASGEYTLPKAGLRLQTRDLIEHWKALCTQYPIASLEDPLGEEDWEGWQVLTQELGDRVQLVGDDLFVTNAERLQRGLQHGCANSILIKPNQAGTLTEAMEAARLARRAGYTAIASHRSGETEDCAVADLAIALNAGLIKTGAPCRGERTAKYNRLLRAAEELGRGAIYPGYSALPFRRIVPSLH